MATQQVVDSGRRNTAAIAVDGSAYSEYAFEWYLENVHRPNDNIVIIHSVNLNDVMYRQRWQNTPYSFDMETFNKIIEEQKENLAEKEQKFEKLLTNAMLDGCVKLVHCSNPGEGICQVAFETNADYIVIGSRGLGTIRRTIIGSVSDYVVHHSHIPVFVCRRE